jgi:hypothetical protein
LRLLLWLRRAERDRLRDRDLLPPRAAGGGGPGGGGAVGLPPGGACDRGGAFDPWPTA